MKAFTSLLFMLCLGHFARAQELMWVDQLKGSYDDEITATAIDDSDNIYISGEASWDVDFDPSTAVDTAAGYGVAYLAKYKSDGTLLWAKRGHSYTYIVPYPTGELLLCRGGMLSKVNSAGDTLWKTYIEHTGDMLTQFACDSDGNVYVGGHFTDTLIFNANVSPEYHSSKGSYDIFLAKYNSKGEFQWAFTIGNKDPNYLHTITADRDGLYAAFHRRRDNDTIIDVDPGPGESFYKYNNGFALVKYNTDGSFGWLKSIDIPTHTLDVIKPCGDQLYMAGFGAGGFGSVASARPPDCYVMAVNRKNGDLNWFHMTCNSLVASDITTDKDGNLYLGGYTSWSIILNDGPAPNTVYYDGKTFDFFAKFNSKGKNIWIKGLEHDLNYKKDYSQKTFIEVGKTGDVFLGTTFGNEVNTDPNGSHKLLAKGHFNDAFIARYRTCDNIPQLRFSYRIEDDTLIRFTSETTGADSIAWYINGRRMTGHSEMIYAIRQTDSLQVYLKAWNRCGTADSMTDIYAVLPPVPETLFIPNAFTSNWDVVNDCFKPAGSGIASYNIKIYNRRRLKLFESDDIRYGWYGKYKGEICQEGVYLYVIHVRFLSGKEKTYTGNLTLYR